MIGRLLFIAAFLTIFGLPAILAAFTTGGIEPDKALERADKLFDEKNYAEAAALYEKVLAAAPRHEKRWRAGERVITCKLRLNLYDDAVEAAEVLIGRVRGTVGEARAERLAGNLYILVPHYGTRAGGVFHRGQLTQGIQVHSWRYDKKYSLMHFDRARALFAKYDADPGAAGLKTDKERAAFHEERIECLFDFVGASSRFGIYDNDAYYWHAWWAERDEFLAETAGEKDFDEFHSSWEFERRRPIGLRLDGDGKPLFPAAPAAYAPDLDDDERILFLLGEIRGLDRTEKGEYAAKSLFLQAMLARQRFGMDRLNEYASSYWTGNTRPLAEELKNFNPWELADDEALVLAGGRIRKAKLPEQWDVLGLLGIVAGDYKKSAVADGAEYTIGLYHQTRQQYVSALAAYERLAKDFPKSDWIKEAAKQKTRIEAPQVRIGDTGVQLPGQPASLQVSYRNTDKIRFVARKIDLEGFLEEFRDKAIREGTDRSFEWQLESWHRYFVDPGNDRNRDQWIRRTAARYVGPEAARWTAAVTNDKSHRYAHAALDTPLEDRGAYLVYAYLSEPPAGDADAKGPGLFGLGASRAVLVLTDLAVVEKETDKGSLYYVADALSGAPAAGAKVSVLEIWNERRKGKGTVYHKRITNLTADGQGLALFPYPVDRHPRRHLLVLDGDRIAWTGMNYCSPYHPSRMRRGVFAYIITDRPVYRPEQTVRFKAWLREMDEGTLEKIPSRSVDVEIYDARGNKVYSSRKQPDPYGNVDGEFTLGEEPPLGMYRINIKDVRHKGGGNFRVEEYKKPEFEVTVEPAKTLLKLGDKVTALIKAKYYFGAPVTDASVKYKVFREEYRHAFYFPGPWDWLYGPGYGRSWYACEWFPWWGRIRSCFTPPGWWSGGGAGPVRELVEEGEAAIGPEGTAEISIDTARALRDHPDRDHRYTIEAEVRDASRRVISGQGAVTVTRNSFYAYVESDRGWVRPGEETEIRVRCLTPGGGPVETEGVVTVSRVVFGGPDNARIEETELDRWMAKTDAGGVLTFRLRPERSGRLDIRFTAPDAWGGTVEGHGLLWVCGRDFDGRLQRFNDLELITDKRSYAPGEVCHLMINTKEADSYVLLSDKVDKGRLLSWRLLYIPGKSTVVDIPIEKEHRPNFFVEATTVAGARVHAQAKRICVPPGEGIVDVSVKTDRAEYRPGRKARITVAARDREGRPVAAQVCLSAFDKSVLYIQPELTPDIRRFFHGNVRTHAMSMITNLTERFSAAGYVDRPFRQIGLAPAAWWGCFEPWVEDWGVADAGELSVGADWGRKYGGIVASTASRKGRRSGGLSGNLNGTFVAEAASPAGGPAGPGGPPAQTRENLDKAFAPAHGGQEPAFAAAKVRREFADTALWLPAVATDAGGTASVEIEMPENLTTWKVNAWAMTKKTRVGHAATEAVTTKNILVRLEAPRFFLESDEAVISANVHNAFDKEKKARVSVDLPAGLLGLMEGFPAERDVTVPAHGAARVDWRVRVVKEGTATITVKALTDEESDAMTMAFPVLVHGMTKQVARTGSMRPGEEKASQTIELVVPKERRPESTRLEVRFAPTLAGAMLDALPYCLAYPYGCTEQTVSRFLPAVLTLKTIRNLGINLDDLRTMHGRMAEIKRIEKDLGRKVSGFVENPVFDRAALNRIIEKSLARLEDMQHGDGGFGWWKGGESSGYMTSYVLSGLLAARECDVKVDDAMIGRGLAFLKRWEEERMGWKDWSCGAQNAFTAYVLSLEKKKAAIKPKKGDDRPGDLVERLFTGRDKLDLYGKALLSLTLANLEDEERGRAVLRNIMQYKEENPATRVAWFRTPKKGWWYWWNSDIETNAWCLRALVRLDPKNDTAPRLVKWLLENRRHGTYWRSTRDTAFCVAAVSDFVLASGEGEPDYTLTLDFDSGAVVKTVKITKDNIFTCDNRFVIEGAALGGGKHTLTVNKDGPGALYYSAYLRYFTKEKKIKAAGLELEAERKYFKLVRIPYTVEVQGSEGQAVEEKRLRYERVLLKDGDVLASGDILQVELKVTSDNDYTYLCLEDKKPAGCEPIDLRSGGKGQEGFSSYMELRDEKTVFFVGGIGRGEHLLRYRLRAEIPGVFHALPAVIYGMYVPELRANSDEQVISIEELKHVK